MKHFISLVTLLLSSLIVLAQKKEVKPIGCSRLLEDISYFWKLDSLGSNGYRMRTYECIKNCHLDGIDTLFLFSKLGKPNEVMKSQNDISYIYYYLDVRRVPAELEYAYACWYISFVFKNGKQEIEYIYEGSLDL